MAKWTFFGANRSEKGAKQLARMIDTFVKPKRDTKVVKAKEGYYNWLVMTRKR